MSKWSEIIVHYMFKSLTVPIVIILTTTTIDWLLMNFFLQVFIKAYVRIFYGYNN